MCCDVLRAQPRLLRVERDESVERVGPTDRAPLGAQRRADVGDREPRCGGPAEQHAVVGQPQGEGVVDLRRRPDQVDPALAVDDHEANLIIIEEFAQRMGMEPLAATSGLEALKLLDESHAAGKPIDLALLDCHMPEMNGLAALEVNP